MAVASFAIVAGVAGGGWLVAGSGDSPPPHKTRGAAPLPAGAAGPISATLGAGDPRLHAARRPDGKVHLANPRHRLAARVDGTGISITTAHGDVGMHLTGIGRGDVLAGVPVGRPVAHANRVSVRQGPVTQWYANGPLGLEQGFTIARAPRGGTGQLTLGLALSGGLRAETANRADGVRFADAHGRTRLAYRGLTVTDATGRRLPARIAVRDGRLLVHAQDHGARYPVTVDPFIQDAELSPSDDGAKYLGESVAIAGDTIVAGASGTGCHGAAYVFVKPATGWADATAVAKLTPSDVRCEIDDDVFMGSSVGISADGRTIVAGAVRHGNSRGAVYVFKRPSAGWADEGQSAVLTSDDVVTGTFLGESVDIAGDDVVAGAPNDDGYFGAVYIFHKPSAGWADMTHQTAKLRPSSGRLYLSLGITVDTDGQTIVAGAPGAGSDDQGAVYVFSRPSGGWADATQTAVLTASDAAPTAGIGFGVAVDGNLIAVPRDIVTGTDTDFNPPAVYVYQRPSGGWDDAHETAELRTPYLPDSEKLFDKHAAPTTVAIEGDTIVAGFAFETYITGAVGVYRKPASGWADGELPDQYFTADQAQRGWGLGGAVPTSTDSGYSTNEGVGIDGGTIVGGAPGAHGKQGRVYVFGPQPPSITITAPTPGAIYRLNQAVAADYRCTAPAGTSVSTCAGTVEDGDPIDTASPGTHHFTVTATDADGASATRTVDYAVAAPPTVTITTPTDGARYRLGQVVTADFSCAAGAGATLRPDPDGCVGTVASGAAIDTSAGGTYAFTVTATDTLGQTRSTTVHYTVVPPPTVTLTSPADGARYHLNDVVPVSFTCAPGAGGVLLLGTAGCFGTLPNGSAIPTTSAGSQTFTATATDDLGQVTARTSSFKVLGPPVNCATAARQVTGTQRGRLSFTSGTACVHDADLLGQVTIGGGANVIFQHVTLEGALTATSGGALAVCDSTSLSSISVSKAGGFVLVGGDEDDLCGGNELRGPLTLTSNTHAAEVRRNHSTAAITVTGTTGTGTFSDDQGAVIGGNTSTVLRCDGNAPIGNDGDPNTAGARQGAQCGGAF